MGKTYGMVPMSLFIFVLFCIIAGVKSELVQPRHKRQSSCGVSLNCQGTAPTCNDQQGQIYMQASGGTGLLQYGLNTQDWFSSPYFSEPEGQYTCYVKDIEDGCITTSSTAVPAGPPAITGGIQGQSNLQCYNSGNTGSFTAFAGGGTPGYTYSIDGSNWVGDTFSNLAPGPYTPTVKDANGCTLALPTVTILQPAEISGSIAGSTNLQCVDSGNTGTITLSGSGGTGSLLYSIDGTNYGSNVFTGLAPGTYTTFFVQDASSCTFQIGGSVTISQPSAVGATITGQSAPACPGGQGSFTIGPSGGNGGPYTFSIDGTNFGSGDTFSVGVGGFTYYVRDQSGCQQSFTGTMQDASNPVTGSIAVQSGFKCATDGSIASVTLSAAQGASPYTYSLDNQNFGDNPTFGNLGEGPVMGYVKDNNGCVSPTNSITLSKPSAITATFDSVNAQCYGTFDPQISGGTGPYTYTLNGTAVTGSRPDGHYAWTVQDSNGCSLSGFVDLTNNANTGLPKITTTSQVPTKGGNLTMTGLFPQPLSVSLDSVLVSCTFPTNSTVVCPVSGGNGGNHTIVVSSGSGGCQKSINTTWSYMNPQVTNISKITVSGGIITIQGTNFGNGTFSPTVTIGKGVPCTGCAFRGIDAIVCTCPYNGSMSEILVVTIDGLSSPPFGFGYSGPPSPPALTLHEHSRSFLQVTWLPAPDGGSAISKYVLFFSNSSKSGPWQNITVMPNSSMSVKFTNLTTQKNLLL